MEEEKNLQNVDAAYDDVDEAYDDIPVPIDEESNDVVEVDEKKKKKKKEKRPKGEKPPKKPLSKSSKVVIIMVSILLLVAILATAIAVPISIANRGKIFVKTATDFSNTDGTHYVLSDDIVVDGDLSLGTIHNIDFNGKTLNVKGTLTINSQDAEPVLLGMDKTEGILEANVINVTSGGEVQFNAVTKTDSLSVNAGALLVNKALSLVDNSFLAAAEVGIYAPVVFADETKENILTINNANNVNINNNLSGNISVIKDASAELPANVYLEGDISGNALMSHNVVLSVNSTIYGKIDTNDQSIIEGVPHVNSKVLKVIIGNGAFVKDVRNVSTVLVDEEAVCPNMTAVDKVDFIRQLERVGYIRVDEVADKVLLSFTPVVGADAYNITIDEVTLETPIVETFLDITSYVKNAETDAISAATYKISVQAISMASPETLKPSKISSYEYTTFITLSSATGIKVDYLDGISMVLPNGKVVIYDRVPMLSFDKVNFADEYVITIDGKTVKSKENVVNIMEYISTKTIKNVTVDGETFEAPEYSAIGGGYIIEIVAVSKNENIKPSKPAVFKHNVIIPLESDTEDKALHLTLTHNYDELSLSLSWSKVPNAKYYEVIMISEDGSEQVIYRTTSSTFYAKVGDKFDGYQVANGKKFQVKAVSNSPYYTPIVSNIEEFKIV